MNLIQGHQKSQNQQEANQWQMIVFEAKLQRDRAQDNNTYV